MKKIKLMISLTIVLAMTFMFVGCSSESAVNLGDDFLEKAHEAVKEAYGEDYIPSMAIQEDFLADIYGVPMDSVKEYIAEGPMMSTHVDTFIGLKVEADSVNKVADALRAYHTDLVENSMQYPMNLAKVQSAEILVIEDHVFFLMLGGFNDNVEQTEEEALEFAKEQVQIAVEAIEGLVK
ncbi:DUF4358 domain-containing protein [Natronincola ferrireducens]|uniref:DUF4358 domain-containing protein n=1 Tax=Natronincola ferrireducens TaxID=393762 RepID=A0A1G8Z8E2_9FIRM|nr:DUF4358 domain-containing protein [Natronincola ferrireducens]SDK10470.1 protein of unknown function [Natronincola ferrireducens]